MFLTRSAECAGKCKDRTQMSSLRVLCAWNGVMTSRLAGVALGTLLGPLIPSTQWYTFSECPRRAMDASDVAAGNFVTHIATPSCCYVIITAYFAPPAGSDRPTPRDRTCLR